MKIPKDVNLDEYISFLGEQEATRLTIPTDHLADLLAEESEFKGDPLPWSKVSHDFRLRPGELTIWAGVNGHGKSMVLSQIILWLLRQRKICLASMEMPPRKSLRRMCRQASGREDYGKAFAEEWTCWADPRLLIYDEADTVPAERILGLVNYAATKGGCQHVVIDSLMKCDLDLSGNGQEAQRDLISRLCNAGKVHNIHIHLVHHVRKAESETSRPDKFDLFGSSMLSNLADNICIVWRNKPKEKKRQAGVAVDVAEPDCILDIAKQRHGETEGSYGLYFDAPSQQFTSKPNGGAMPWNK